MHGDFRGPLIELGLEFTSNPGHTLLECVDEARMKLESSPSKWLGEPYR